MEGCNKPKLQKKLIAALSIGDVVDAVVELVKADAMYMVLSLPSHGASLAYAATCDFNMQRGSATRVFQHGQKLSATVVGLPGGEGGRVLLHVPLAVAAPVPTVSKGKLKAGATATARVTAIHALHADLQIGKVCGHLHITELRDLTPANALAQVRALQSFC